MMQSAIHRHELFRLGYGCMGIVDTYENDRDDQRSIQTIQKAYASGVRIFDTADVYGEGGHSEIVLGRALREVLKTQRSDILIATKTGFLVSPSGAVSIDISPERIKRSCEASLERLGIDYIDIYYLHRPSARGFDALRETLEGLIDLARQDKIKGIGLSEFNAESIRFVYAYLTKRQVPHLLRAVQSELSLFVQEHLHDGVFNTCQELGLMFIPFSPLCRGFLSEKFNPETVFEAGDFRRELPMFQGENFRANLIIRDKLLAFATEKHCTLPQLSLAWLLSLSPLVYPIPGTRHEKNLLENLGALAVKLDHQDIERLNDIVTGQIQGMRYTEDMLRAQNLLSPQT